MWNFLHLRTRSRGVANEEEDSLSPSPLSPKQEEKEQDRERNRERDEPEREKGEKNTHLRLAINQPDARYGATPLYYACQRGHVAKVKRLLGSTGVEVNCVAECWGMACLFVDDYRFPSKFYRTPLHVAVARGYTQIVQLLLAHPRINVNLYAHNMTALHAAVLNGQKHILEVLLRDRRININCHDDAGNTPLHVACMSPSVECLEQLLQHDDIIVDVRNHEGVLPFVYAIGSQDDRIIDAVVRFYRTRPRRAYGL